MPTISSHKLIEILKKEGFQYQVGRGKGDHRIFKKGELTAPPIPHPKKDLPLGTVRSILKGCGIDPAKYIR